MAENFRFQPKSIFMNRLIKKLMTFIFLGLLSTAIMISCGKQAKEGDHPAGEHPSDTTANASDTTEHPDHPAEHPADSTK
jgi:hypothetical protein